MSIGVFNCDGNIGVTVGPLIFGGFMVVSDFYMTFFVAGIIEVTALVIVIILIRIMNQSQTVEFILSTVTRSPFSQSMLQNILIVSIRFGISVLIAS